MGRGDTKPDTNDPKCPVCKEPQHREDGELHMECKNKENHQRREKPKPPSWPSGYPQVYAEPASDEVVEQAFDPYTDYNEPQTSEDEQQNYEGSW